MNVLHTVPETAKILGLKTTDAVYQRISDGRLRAVNIAKPGERSKTRIRSDDLENYIEACTQPAIKRAS